MSTCGPTSFYSTWQHDGVPQPPNDPPEDHGDGVDSDARPDPARAPRGDEHDAAQGYAAPGTTWGKWSEGQRSSWWGHSWGDADPNWNRSGWAQNSGNGQHWDPRWQDWRGWGSASTGSGSGDGNCYDRDSKDSGTEPWGRFVSAGDSRGIQDGSQVGGWGPATDAQGKGFHGRPSEGGRGPSEKMIVPSFSGSTGDQGDDIGTSARSYLRQVSAWRRMTRMSVDQQGLTLYQHLTDKAWIDAERLDVDRLATKEGVDYLIAWIKDRYLDVQVTQIGRSLSGFFRGLHRKANQSVRDYMAEFDRAFARLGEVGCHLPDVAAAWVFVDRMGLEEQAELNLLASVGNQYSLKSLQQAAIVHDRGLRKPWETQNRAPRKEWTPKKAFTANMAAIDEEGPDGGAEDEFLLDQDSHDCVSEDVAENLYHAYMTHETAKAKYRENMKLRGSDPNSLKQLAMDKLRVAKSKSFCAGCRRRGHWHKDAECPLNKGTTNGNGSGTATTTPPKETVKPSYPCHVVHVTWEITGGSPQELLAITDTACSRSVAGAGWIDLYLTEARRLGCEPMFVQCGEAFRFGASRVFTATYGVILCFELGSKKVCLKVAVVNGEVPLLVSRPALGKMGMIIDVENNSASFRVLDVRDMALQITDTGHPAFPVHPAVIPKSSAAAPNWESTEIKIFSLNEQYMACTAGLSSVSELSTSESRIDDRDVGNKTNFEYVFYPKKIGSAAKNHFLDEKFNPETFATWWSDLLTAPMVSRPKTLSEFTKAELIEEATARNLWFHPTWTVTEIRSLIQEDRRNPSGNHPADAGMSKLTLEQLKERAMEKGYHLPPYATKGTIMRILRDQAGMGPQSILTFGRFKGKMFKETPESYRTWALKEVTSHDNPSEDLVMFANWWREEMHRWRESPNRKATPDTEIYLDPEEHATIPYIEDATSTTSWDMVNRETEYPGALPKALPGSSSLQAPRTPPRRRGPEAVVAPTPTTMDQDLPPDVTDEVKYLEDYDEDYDEVYFECDEEKADFLSNQAQATKGNEYPGHGDDEETDQELDVYVEGMKVPDVFYQTNMNSGGSGDVVQREPPGVSRRQRVRDCEECAKDKMKNKAFDYSDLLTVVRLLPLRRLRTGKALKRGGGLPFHYFIAGMYTHGPFVGVTKSGKELPWTIKYINSFVRAQGVGEWTSFAIFRNTATECHTDTHNMAGTHIKTVSFGEFTGGELWIHGEAPEGKVFSFDGKALHATQPWEGERWALSCYTTRGYTKGTIEMRDELRELRFPLRGIPIHDEPGQSKEDAKDRSYRPPKSIRKGLWKKASRLAALTAWCTAAASTCVYEEYPLGRGQGAVSLFEIGGYEKTIEITDLDYLVAEPYAYDFHAEDNRSELHPHVVRDTIEEMKPAVLWVHAPKIEDLLPAISEHLCTQVDRGGQLVIEAPPGHPCWTRKEIKDLLERYDNRWSQRRGEPHLWRINDEYENTIHHDPKEDLPEFLNYMVKHETREGDEDNEEKIKRGGEGITFEQATKIAPEVRSSLRRLHQNLGHPSNTDLARHLRLAGADPTVVEATKKIRCQVCSRHQRAASAKPASLPNMLDFNQLVAVDAFYVYDVNGVKVELMMVVDVGTGFIATGHLQGHSTSTMEASFCSIWSNTFGAPGTMIVDLESGLQAGLGRYSEWHGTRIRPIAGQAHWQNGTVERAIRTWKEIWVKLVDTHSATHEETDMVVTSVNAAMNTLRRDAGFSPAQAVWGRNPQLPDEVHNGPQDEHVEHIITHDPMRAREHSIRSAAKEAYFRCHNDSRIRKGLLQRSRVAGPDLQIGSHVLFYRKPKGNKNWAWHGPGVVIGKEGPNLWVSFAGRCHLAAPEHVRMATGEELGEAFTLRATQHDLQRLLEQDFADEGIYEQEDEEMEEDPVLPPGDDEAEPEQERGEGSRRKQPEANQPPVVKRHRTKGPQGPSQVPAANETYMMKLAKTPRGREKALEKEIPWSLIPPEQQENFRQAEWKQWTEHVEHDALEPLSVTESREITKTKPGRILGSRFAYRDKLWSRRRAQPDVGWKPKARLVIGGHRDPDLTEGLATHAPTISRQGIHLLFQILASNLSKGWRGFAGDVTAAFLCGEDLSRELYLRQPRTGLGNLHPEQLLRIKKPIFGLVDSPAAWWNKFQKVVKKLRIRDENDEWVVVQSTLDHCIFMVQRVRGHDEQGELLLDPPAAYLGVHVDDVLLVGEGGLCDLLKKELSAQFPIQASYASTRLFEIETAQDIPDHFEATEVQKHDNQSLIGALSWMACQTRPDLQVGVSMSQQRQKAPTVGDVKFTNQLARRAAEHREQGLVFYPVDLDSAVLLCYHDAGWANAPQSQEDPYYQLTTEEDQQGLILDGPYARKDAKTKKANSTIASQLGGVYILANKAILRGEAYHGSILDWKSGACERVCRSTFAAETMACCNATETGDFITRFLETLLTGRLARKTSRFEMRFLSDCRSLYDHLTRDGVPRVPTSKRLAIDLAGIREDLKSIGRIAWVPTGLGGSCGRMPYPQDS
ncbi:RE2 [Symbiodinium sp. CCMP2592]|nr:RE2 [Symbiodinium sp. CCMP2592]